MRMVATELGGEVKVETGSDRNQVLALTHPLTLAICLEAQHRNIPLGKIFVSRNISDETYQERLTIAARHFTNFPDQIPPLSIRLAMAHHLVKYMLPMEDLKLARIVNGRKGQEFNFSTGTLQKPSIGHIIPPPVGLDRSKIALWNNLKPYSLIIAMDQDSIASRLALRNVETNFLSFDAAQSEAIRTARMDLLLMGRANRVVLHNDPNNSQQRIKP